MRQVSITWRAPCGSFWVKSSIFIWPPSAVWAYATLKNTMIDKRNSSISMPPCMDLPNTRRDRTSIRTGKGMMNRNNAANQFDALTTGRMEFSILSIALPKAEGSFITAP